MSDSNFKGAFHIEFTRDNVRYSVGPPEFLTWCDLLGYAPPFTIVMEQPS